MSTSDRFKEQEDEYLRSTIQHDTAMNLIEPLSETFPAIHSALNKELDQDNPDIGVMAGILSQSFRDLVDDIQEKPILDKAIQWVDHVDTGFVKGINNPWLLEWLARARRRIHLLQEYIKLQNTLFDEIQTEDMFLIGLDFIDEEIVQPNKPKETGG